MKRSFLGIILVAALQSVLGAEYAREVSQYGVTWTFDKEYRVGQFVSGDWWVVGPAKIVEVTPNSGPSESDGEAYAEGGYGATGLVDDRRMRNGSMLNPGVNERGEVTGLNKQGFDSRSKSYQDHLAVEFPLLLQPDDTLLSSVSSENYDAKGKLTTPYVLGQQRVFYTKKTGPFALESLAILTCLADAPPEDAFRPPYASLAKPLYLARDIQWEKLPKLPAPDSVPSWAMIERIYERPWVEIPSSWLTQFMGPSLNHPNYGREIQRMSAIASLMLMLDVPNEQKKSLLYNYLQWGIDLRGTISVGRDWSSDGGHWQGRKWPILFAGLMFEEPAFLDLGETKFQEDMDTYYGRGADGQKALWRMVWHTRPVPPYQEKPRSEYTDMDKKSENYRFINSSASFGVALAARLMGAKDIWDHDPFFDYIDYYMGPNEKYPFPKWLPSGATRSADRFVEDMWNAYRD